MKLYYDPASTVCRGLMLFIAEHDIQMDYEHVSLFAGENLEPPFLAINPNGAVPVLEDDDFRLTESSAIFKYLADKVGSAAYPACARERARVHAAMDWFNTGFYHSLGYDVVYCQILPQYALPSPEAQAQRIALGRQMAARKLAVLNDHMIGDNRFVCGDQITLADYFGLPLAALGELVDFDFSPWPNVVRWLSTLKSRPAWPAVDVAFQGWKAAMRAQAA